MEAAQEGHLELVKYLLAAGMFVGTIQSLKEEWLHGLVQFYG